MALATAVVALGVGGCSIDDIRSDDAEATPTMAAQAATPTGVTPLRIVTPTPFPIGVTTPAAQTPTPEEVPSVYVVQENDTLYGIAARFDIELGVLIELNGLSDPNDIQVGQELRLRAE